MADTRRVTLTPRTDDWDELTELAEDISAYVPDRAAVYAAIQAIAEGRTAAVEVPRARVGDFVGHMREFRIDASPAA